MDDVISLSSMDSSDSLKSLLSGISITSINSDRHNERSMKTHRSMVSDNPKGCFKRHLSLRLSRKSMEDEYNEERLRLTPNIYRCLSAPGRKSYKYLQDCNDNSSINDFLADLENNSGNRSSNLSPRQQWLAKKKAHHRKLAQQLAKLKKEEKDKRRQEEEELRKRKCLAREKLRTWLKSKRLETMKQKELAEIAQTEEIIRATNKRTKEIKAQEKFKEWLELKKQAKIAEKQQRETERRAGELAEIEKRKRAEESYQAWLRINKATHTKRKTPYTKCISGGVVIKYFDRMAAPEPEFVNKNTWVS